MVSGLNRSESSNSSESSNGSEGSNRAVEEKQKAAAVLVILLLWRISRVVDGKSNRLEKL